MLTRRHLLLAGAAAAMAGGLPRPSLARAKPHVAVIGGGAGGLSVLRRLVGEGAAKGGLRITLVEPNPVYTTCFYSNLYLGGFQSLDTLQYDYRSLKALPDVTVAEDNARAIDLGRRRILLASGNALDYDRLVLSPGIDLDYTSVPGWSEDAEERMPHGWKTGAQFDLLKRQLGAVPDGGLIVVVAPPNPYRCPPGPYERASMMAHALKSSGRGGARIIIIDAKDTFSKQALFMQGWERHYPGMIEWIGPKIHGGLTGVDPASMSVRTDFETLRNAALVNVIPRQTAGAIAREAGLADRTGYCPIDSFSMKSRSDPNVFVVGDSCSGGDMPKSAFCASSQAQTAASVIRHELLGEAAPAIEYNNTCWSMIAPDDSVKVGGMYKPTPEKITEAQRFISALDDSPQQRRANYEDSAAWYASQTAAMFGS